jgi:hypothetical protein
VQFEVFVKSSSQFMERRRAYSVKQALTMAVVLI